MANESSIPQNIVNVSIIVQFQAPLFMVLAASVNNLYIFVQELQVSKREEGELIPEHMGRVLGIVGPSMLLCSLSESVALALGKKLH